MIDLHEPLTDQQAGDMCEALARRVVALGLTTPTVLFLEIHKPLSRLAGQALIVASPILAPVFGLDGVGAFSRLVYHPGGIDRLIARIEELADSKKEDSSPPGEKKPA